MTLQLKASLDSVPTGPTTGVLLDDPGHGVVGEPGLGLHHQHVASLEEERGGDVVEAGGADEEDGGEAEADGEEWDGEVGFAVVETVLASSSLSSSST